ncbi:hypothetical protein HG531_012968 [Fusarium graminearum]|nr:hypothetical protein HG531_012968 [Fusarium graminearum]
MGRPSAGDLHDIGVNRGVDGELGDLRNVFSLLRGRWDRLVELLPDSVINEGTSRGHDAVLRSPHQNLQVLGVLRKVASHKNICEQINLGGGVLKILERWHGVCHDREILHEDHVTKAVVTDLPAEQPKVLRRLNDLHHGARNAEKRVQVAFGLADVVSGEGVNLSN